MVTYEPKDGTWELDCEAKVLKGIRNETNPEDYEEDKQALQEFLCGYFSAHNDCLARQGDSICPMGKSPRGGRVLKVRWALPGGGKSSSLRLVVVAYCDDKRVVIAEGTMRKNDPSKAWVKQIVKHL